MVRFLRHALLIVLWLGLYPAPSVAAPTITETTRYYLVSATTATDLKREMRAKGPKGFWGLTRWDIRWTADCQVTARIVYTLPRHRRPDALSPPLRRAFDTMVRNLAAHERLHGQNGRTAALEIDRAGCRGASAIIRKYNEADRTLDRLTRHGATQGVNLRTRDRSLPSDRELR